MQYLFGFVKNIKYVPFVFPPTKKEVPQSKQTTGGQFQTDA